MAYDSLGGMSFPHTPQTADYLIACLVQCQIRSILFLRLREIHLEPTIIDYQVVSSRKIIARADVPYRPVEWHITRSVECLSHHTPQTEDNLIACLVQCQIRNIIFLQLREKHLEPAIIDYQVVSSRKRCR